LILRCFPEEIFDLNLKMSDCFGLDIGSNTIKIVQLAKEKNFFRLVAAGMAKTPPVDLSFVVEKDLLTMAEAIKKLKDEAAVTVNRVAMALPESKVFTQVVEFPRMKEEELKQAIPWEAEDLVPQPLAEVNLDWEIIDDEESVKDNKTKIVLVAAPKILVAKYLQLCKMAGLELAFLETETLALVRALRPIFNQNDIILTNLGAKSLDIILIHKGNLFLTRQLPTSGEAINRALANSLGLDLPAAEEYKKTYGLSEQLEGKVAGAIQPIVMMIADELKKSTAFFKEKSGSSSKLLLISGGTSLLPGIAEFLAQSLGLEVQVADPLSMLNLNQQGQPWLKKNSPLFAVACGLAMR